ncbi:MAG: PAS domain S-box protein [Chloroflexi bacterium]|nr:PAS domain S-box protein [Chloroflexota bacterium]
MTEKKPTYEELEKRVREFEQADAESGHTLFESEEFYRIMVERTGQMVYDYDVLSGNIKWAGAISEILRYSLEEFQDINIDKWLELIHEEDRELALALLEESMSKCSKYKVEYRLRRKDGSFVFVDDSGHFLRDEAGKVYRMLGSMRDISERKQAEQALRESEEIYRITAQKTGQMVYDYDPATGKVKWEGAVEAITGHTYEEIQKCDVHGWADSIHEEDRQAVIEALEIARQECSTFDVEYRFRQKDGSYLYIEEHGVFLSDSEGKEVRMLGSLKDITERKRAEEEISSLTQFQGSIIDSADVWLNVLDSNGNVLIWNKAAEQISGYSKEEVIENNKIWEWTYPEKEYREKVFEKARKIIQEQEVIEDFETRIRCKDGNEKIISWNSKSLSDMDGKSIGSVALGRDVTMLKQAEQALRESEECFRGLMDQSPVSIQILDINGMTVNANIAWEKLWGVSWEKFIKLDYNILEDKQVQKLGLIPYLRRAYSGEAVFVPAKEYDVQETSGVGNRRWVQSNIFPIKNESGKIINIVIEQEDITERKQAEETLHSEKQFIDKAIDSLPGIFYLFPQDGKFLRWNRNFEIVSGYTGEEIGRMYPRDFFPVEEYPLVEERIGEVFAKGESFVEANWLSKDGTKTLHYLTGVRVDIDGISCQVGMGIDISDRKQLEEERSKSTKLESIGLLAGGIAHDFNNILTTILSNVSLAKMMLDGEGNDEIKDRLTQSELAGRRAAELTQQLLTFSRGGAPVKKTAMLGNIVRESTGFSLSGSNVKCRHYIDKDIWPCSVDSGQISQVINNLVINADQAMPEGGVIEIRVKNVVVSSKDALPLEEGKYVRVTVKDQGIGISKQHISKIFDPYYTTKQKGSGLGLATCYSIVVRHDGHIAVESEPGVGTSFHVYLPATSGRVRQKGNEKGKATLPAGRVLVMDDEPSVLEVLVGVLESFGQEAQGAADGAEAVKLYKRAMKSGKPFDAVILDLTVPGGMGGRETVEKLQRIDPEVKTIVSSGYSNDPVMANFKEYGFSGVVSKPYQIEEMKNVLHEVMKKNG